MPGDRRFTRVDTLELKSRIERKIGRVNVEKYFYLVTRFLSLKIEKPEFDKLCIDKIGQRMFTFIIISFDQLFEMLYFQRILR